MSVAETMRTKLTEALQPEHLDIVDESHLHAGHAGHDGRGESHFSVFVVSTKFEGQGRVARQRMVYGILKEEMADRVHALALKTLSPTEAASSALGG